MAENKNFIKRTIENEQFLMTEVEIIIPFYGEQARVAKLMESIFNTVFTNRYLITLVDDGSINKHFIQKIKDKSNRLPGVRCFQIDEQKGFGAAVNYALKNPWVFRDKPNKQIPYVCIMQSDTYPEDNQWLAELGRTLLTLKESDVKMVSPRTNNSMSKLDILTGKKGEKTDNKILTDGFLPLYCALFHRELFNRIGLLKEFPYAGCEAEEFADRMKKHGYKQAVSGNSWIHHDGGATLSLFAKNKSVQKILRNVEKEFSASKKVEVDQLDTHEVG